MFGNQIRLRDKSRQCRGPDKPRKNTTSILGKLGPRSCHGRAVPSRITPIKRVLVKIDEIRGFGGHLCCHADTSLKTQLAPAWPHFISEGNANFDIMRTPQIRMRRVFGSGMKVTMIARIIAMAAIMPTPLSNSWKKKAAHNAEKTGSLDSITCVL